MRRTPPLATVLALSLAGCLGACGGDAPDPDPEPTTAATSAVDAAGTEPGTDLRFGEPATLAWQASDDVEGQVELSVDAVAEQRRSVFDGWRRDDAMAASRPYFVTVSMTNTGESDLGGMQVPLYLRDDNGSLGAPWTVGGDFAACQSGPFPEPFAAGDETEMCLVYLVPDGARIQDMVFEPSDGFDPITWTGDVGEPGGSRPDRQRAKHG